MLTPDQLAAIKEHLNLTRKMDSDKVQLCTNIAALLADHERLTRHNQRMAAALAQLSDIGNWEYLAPDQRPAFLTVWCYSGPDNPAVLAERALVENN